MPHPPEAAGTKFPVRRDIASFPKARWYHDGGITDITGPGLEDARLGGVFRVCTQDGAIAHYGTSWDLASARVDHLRRLVRGAHEHFWLQAQYQQFGRLANIRFEVVEMVARPARRTALPNIQGNSPSDDWRSRRAFRRAQRVWDHRGGDQVNRRSSSSTTTTANTATATGLPGGAGMWVGGAPPPEMLPVQAFTYDKYEQTLQRRLHAHQVQFLKRRLKQVLRGYNLRQMVPSLRTWQAMFWRQRKRERNAAATQVQRVARGRRTRQALHRWRVKRAVRTIQCAWRRRVAVVRVSKLRWNIVSFFAARVIQHAFQTHLAMGVARLHIVHVRRSRAALVLQRVLARGCAGRARVAFLRLERCAIRIQCRWRIKQGGLALHLKRQHARAAATQQQIASITIQCCARQWRACKDRRAKEHARLERAAVRIQCRWRIKQGGLAAHMMREHKKQERAYAEHVERCAIRIQCRWRIKQGGLALHLKRQAKRRTRDKAEWRAEMATRIQHWWSVVNNTYASKLILRAKRQRKKEHRAERKAMENAALRVQCTWRKRQGGLALHLKRQARRIEEHEWRSASRLQMWWHTVTGNFAAQLKARARLMQRRDEIAAETERAETERAALRVQCMWRKRQGGLALHLKRQAKKHAEAEARLRHETAHKIQVWWSHVTGGFAAKMKARAKMQLIKEERAETAAAHKIQVWWSHVTGGFAAKMKARAKMQLVKEERAETAAAHKIQVWWSHVTGGFAAKMKARAKMQLIKEERIEMAAAHHIQLWWSHVTGGFAAKMKARAKMQIVREDQMAHRLQLWWHRISGTYANRIKERARAEIKKEWEQKERAVLMVQARWRTKKGQFAYHLKQKALRRLANTVDDWVRFTDEWSLQPYYYSETLDRSVYFLPDSFVEPGEWYKVEEEAAAASAAGATMAAASPETAAEYSYWDETTQQYVESAPPAAAAKSAYYVKLREEDAAIWKDGGLSMETEELEAECERLGLLAEGLSRKEYTTQIRDWLENISAHVPTAWELPQGATLVDAPRMPRLPRTYLRINGFYRRNKRQGLNANEKRATWSPVRKHNLDRFILKNIHPVEAKKFNKAAFRRRGSQVNLRKEIELAAKREEANKARLAELASRKHVSPLKNKKDLHDYVVRRYAKRRKRLEPLKVKHESKIERGARVRVKAYVGGFVSLENCVRYYPGKVIRVRRTPGVGDEGNTYDVLLDSGTKRTGQRRDQVYMEFEEPPSAKTHKEELRLQALLDGTLLEDEGEEKDEEPTFQALVNTKKLANRLMTKFKGDGGEGESRGSTRGSTRGSSRDGLTSALNAKLKAKREDLASRGSIASRASSRLRTPGFT
jgi:hypothetical protein